MYDKKKRDGMAVADLDTSGPVGLQQNNSDHLAGGAGGGVQAPTDAERYQSLRGWICDMESDVLHNAMAEAGYINDAPTEVEFDRVIDAAILASKGGAA